MADQQQDHACVFHVSVRRQKLRVNEQGGRERKGGREGGRKEGRKKGRKEGRKEGTYSTSFSVRSFRISLYSASLRAARPHELARSLE